MTRFRAARRSGARLTCALARSVSFERDLVADLAPAQSCCCSVLGGIYGRPVVLANLTLYFISARSLLRALAGGAASPGVWVVAGPAVALAVAYGARLLRGPFDPLQRPGDRS